MDEWKTGSMPWFSGDGYSYGGEAVIIPPNGNVIPLGEGPDAHKTAAAIVAAMNNVTNMAERLLLAADWFDEYAELHRAKGTPEAKQKAETNAYRAEACRAAANNP